MREERAFTSDIRILIVESDSLIAIDIESAMAERFGAAAELIVVDSVTQAQRAVAAELPCALLDIDVVGGKTFDVAEHLMRKGTPFAFVSGSISFDVTERLRQVRFLRKPFSTREIASFVTVAVAGSAAP